jgi:hypothetical protein
MVVFEVDGAGARIDQLAQRERGLFVLAQSTLCRLAFVDQSAPLDLALLELDLVLSPKCTCHVLRDRQIEIVAT